MQTNQKFNIKISQDENKRIILHLTKKQAQFLVLDGIGFVPDGIIKVEVSQ